MTLPEKCRGFCRRPAPRAEQTAQVGRCTGAGEALLFVLLHPAEAFVIQVPDLAGKQRVTQRPADGGQKVAVDGAVRQPLLRGGHLGESRANDTTPVAWPIVSDCALSSKRPSPCIFDVQ